MWGRVAAAAEVPPDPVFRRCWAALGGQFEHLSDRFGKCHAIDRFTGRSPFARGFPRETKNRTSSFECSDLACGCALQVFVFFDGWFCLLGRTLGARRTVEPAIHGFPVFFRKSVRCGAHKQTGFLLRAQQSIELLQALKRCFTATDIKEIAFFRQDYGGLGCHCGQEIFVIKSQSECTGWALLGVGRQFVFQIASKRCDETGGSGHGPTPFQTTQPGGHRPPARVAGHAQMCGIDFFAGE